jgi:hypothetical protein
VQRDGAVELARVAAGQGEVVKGNQGISVVGAELGPRSLEGLLLQRQGAVELARGPVD